MHADAPLGYVAVPPILSTNPSQRKRACATTFLPEPLSLGEHRLGCNRALQPLRMPLCKRNRFLEHSLLLANPTVQSKNLARPKAFLYNGCNGHSWQDSTLKMQHPSCLANGLRGSKHCWCAIWPWQPLCHVATQPSTWILQIPWQGFAIATCSRHLIPIPGRLGGQWRKAKHPQIGPREGSTCKTRWVKTAPKLSQQIPVQHLQAIDVWQCMSAVANPEHPHVPQVLLNLHPSPTRVFLQSKKIRSDFACKKARSCHPRPAQPHRCNDTRLQRHDDQICREEAPAPVAQTVGRRCQYLGQMFAQGRWKLAQEQRLLVL